MSLRSYLPTMCVVLLAIPVAQFASAADPPNRKNFAAARMDEVDADFDFQGEYFGQIQAVCGTAVPLGIQVAALGDGQFSALGFQGGLPGNGWNQKETIAWEGERKENVLVVKGPRGRLIVRQDVATVVDTDNKVVGNVPKVRRVSRSLGAIPPLGATILFDGSDALQFQEGKVTPEGWLDAGTLTQMSVGDFQLHIEFKVPYMPYAREQGRGNSGVYIQQRYEVQILDSFGLPPVFNGCGALYRQQTADLNLSFPPLAWQTYDIDFTAPRWDETGAKIADARITVKHNGVVIHDNRTVPNKTGAGKPEGADDLPIRLQHHGNPVHFRNIWIVDRRPEVTQVESAATQPVPADFGPLPSCEHAEVWPVSPPIAVPDFGGRGWVLWKG